MTPIYTGQDKLTPQQRDNETLTEAIKRHAKEKANREPLLANQNQGKVEDGEGMIKYPWMAIARSKLGEHEIPGPRANAFIVECLKSTTIGAPENRSDETAWCSAFVNRVMQLAGIKGTNSAWARSWLDWGREPTDEEFGEGVIVVLSRGPNFGHVGFLVNWSEDFERSQVKLLAGNQGNAVSEVWFPMSRVLGYRVPA